jgi:hypothetical protein
MKAAEILEKQFWSFKHEIHQLLNSKARDLILECTLVTPTIQNSLKIVLSNERILVSMKVKLLLNIMRANRKVG